MENIGTNIEDLFKKAERYTMTSVQLLRLNTIDKTSDIISSLAIVITMILIVALFTIISSIGSAIYIGHLINDYPLGFFIVSVAYIIVGLIVYVFRKKLIKIPLDNLVVGKLLKKREER